MLVVFVGLPGSGKTTLARRAAAELKAAHLRIDAIEAAVIRTGSLPPLGPVGYAVAHEVAASCLVVGTPVVIDAVSPVPEARQGWTALAALAGVPIRVVEVAMTDRAEHQRRVEARRSDLVGLVVPTWAQVLSIEYEPWDVVRDGPRLFVTNDGELDEALALVLAYLGIK